VSEEPRDTLVNPLQDFITSWLQKCVGTGTCILCRLFIALILIVVYPCTFHLRHGFLLDMVRLAVFQETYRVPSVRIYQTLGLGSEY